MTPGLHQLQRPAAGTRAAAGKRRIQAEAEAGNRRIQAEAGNLHCIGADSRQVQGSQAEGSLHIPDRDPAQGMLVQPGCPVLGTRHVASSRLQRSSGEGQQSVPRGGSALSKFMHLQPLSPPGPHTSSRDA